MEAILIHIPFKSLVFRKLCSILDKRNQVVIVVVVVVVSVRYHSCGQWPGDILSL